MSNSEDGQVCEQDTENMLRNSTGNKRVEEIVKLRNELVKQKWLADEDSGCKINHYKLGKVTFPSACSSFQITKHVCVLGWRTYLELPELLKAHDIDVPQQIIL